jgi:hypothetical protein
MTKPLYKDNSKAFAVPGFLQYLSFFNLLLLRNMAITTSTIKIDNMMKNVLSSLTDPFGRIKIAISKNIVLCTTYTANVSM